MVLVVVIALGIVGDHGRQTPGGIVLVIDGNVLLGGGFQGNAILVETALRYTVIEAIEILDGANGAVGVIEMGFVDAVQVVGRAVDPARGVVFGE